MRTAVRLELLDGAVQAVDGTKVAANAAKKRTYDEAGLQRLWERTEAAIADLEAQNEGGEDLPPPRLPPGASGAALQERMQAALREVGQGRQQVNLTDPDARLMPGRQGYVTGYNAQLMVAPLAAAAETAGILITATAVVQETTEPPSCCP